MSDPTQPTPGTPPAGTNSATVDLMRRELADVQRQIRDLQQLQSSGRMWVAGTLVVTVALFGLFTYYTYSRITGNFDPQAMQTAISLHGTEVLPMAQRLLTDTSRDVLPVYRDAVAATFRARGPQAATAAVTRMREIPKKTGEAFQAKVALAFEDAVKRVEPDFKAAFPNVPDDRRQQMMQTFAMDQIDAQNKRVATEVEGLYTKDLIHMQSVLDKFNLRDPDASTAGQAELEKRFLHTMVALLDDQVDAAYPVVDADGVIGKRRSSTRPTTAPTASAALVP